MNRIFNIVKNKKKLAEIKKIANQYGMKLTSSLLMSICILITSNAYSRKIEASNDANNSLEIESFSSRTLHRNSQLESYEVSPLMYTHYDDLKEDLHLVTDTITYEEEKESSLVRTSYRTITPLSNQEKIEIILNKFNISEYELEVCCAIACAEANGEGMNYEEALNVICTAYNRTLSSAWVNSFGSSIYGQMTAPNQFVVYQNGTYLNYMGKTSLPGYQAVIDFLSNTTTLEGHNYLSFRSNNSNINGVELVDGGNLYFNSLTEEDRIDTEEVARL